MIEPALSALASLLEPMRLLALFGGMVVGLVFGMLPGLGGVAAVSILLPFITLLDDYSGLAMLLGAVSVVYTSDTITSVLLGAPGSPASAPTAIEGHALAKEGQAARALGVGFLASMVGGLMGALILLFAIPVAGPIVLMLSTPELFMFALVGLVFASSMVGRDLARGLASACLGLLLGVVGPASAAADFRFTFDQAYLLDGLSLTIVALGLFGVAEVVSMLAAGGGISGERIAVTRWGEGVRDFVRLRWLILRASIIGVFGGFVPAVGASASTWVAYGHAIRSSRDRSRFGRGEIRGVAAAEGANNATVISDLVPTLLFSVPGGPAAAIFLGALFSFGYYPGPRMITQNPDLMYLIVWSVALTSVVGAVACFAVTPWIARLTRIPFAIIAAPLVLIMVIGAYQNTGTIGDIFMLFALGALGWTMKHAGWPRAPALVGFVLAGPMEQYFWLTNQIHGWSWLARPGVLILGGGDPDPADAERRALAAWAPWGPAARTHPRRRRPPTSPWSRWSWPSSPPRPSAMRRGRCRAFAPSSRLMPSLAIWPGLALSAWLVLRGVREYAPPSGEALAEPLHLGVLIGYAVAVWAAGFILPTVALLAWMLFSRAGMRAWTGALYGVAVFAAVWTLFHFMRGDPPTGALLPLS